MNKIITPASLVMALLFVSTVQAETSTPPSYSLSPKMGALNSGFDLSYPINDRLNARLSVNNQSTYLLNNQSTHSPENFSLLTGTMTMVDYHPFASSFRLSAGLFSKNDHNARNSNNLQTFNGSAYDLSDTHFNGVTPYLGLGWKDGTKRDNEWHFNVDAGILITPDESASLIPVAISNGVSTHHEHSDSDLQALPVISLETSYRF